MPTEIGAVNFHRAAKLGCRLNLGSHRLPEFVRQNETRLVGRAQVAAQGEHALALHLIAEDSDCHEVAAQRELAAGEQRTGGQREVLAAGLALPQQHAAPAPLIDLRAPAFGAVRRAAVVLVVFAAILSAFSAAAETTQVTFILVNDIYLMSDQLMPDGKRRVVVNSVGKEMKDMRLSEQEAIPGKQIQLSIDFDLQQVAEQSLGARPGAVVALDPRTGEVLAMASHPALDPNDFAIRVSAAEWKKLNEDPEKPLLNRAIQAQLAPGSVFKIVMATAMYETKAVPESFSVFCPGYGTFYGRQFKCWVYWSHKPAHGTVDIHKAVNQSCDIFFYTLGPRLGIDRISYFASKFGLGRRTGIDLPSEVAQHIGAVEAQHSMPDQQRHQPFQEIGLGKHKVGRPF